MTDPHATGTRAADRVEDRAYCAACQDIRHIAIFRGIAGIVMARCLACHRAWPWSHRG